ncbi:hypothetical protein UFO1_0877 [Pelosinus sp. UFO1]|jgi:hypothetical protein|nr:hypothetical protein UFO1_0877 [Pelosinus sp. UFO1]
MEEREVEWKTHPIVRITGILILYTIANAIITLVRF